MHQLVTSAMTLLLAAHVTLGCCWHHGHAACARAECEGSASGDGHEFEHQACEATGHVTADPCAPHHQCSPWSHPCEDGHCAFTGVVRDIAGDDVSDVPMPFAWDGAPQTTVGPAAATPRSDAALPTIFPPARRHLLLEVLLI